MYCYESEKVRNLNVANAGVVRETSFSNHYKIEKHEKSITVENVHMVSHMKI